MDKTVAVVNGVVLVNGMDRGHIVKGYPKGWVLDTNLSGYLNLEQFHPQSWPTRKAAATWVKAKIEENRGIHDSSSAISSTGSKRSRSPTRSIPISNAARSMIFRRPNTSGRGCSGT